MDILRKEFKHFATSHNILGLTLPTLKAVQQKKHCYTIDRARQFLKFQNRINEELLKHKVITDNPFTKWFEKGEASYEQVKAFLVQFSVFSNLFLIAQLKKMINATTLEGMRESKEILANEIGVIFNARLPRSAESKGEVELAMTDKTQNDEVDPQLVSTHGTVEGGKFRFAAAHFEWLYNIAQKFGLSFHEIGKRRHGTKETLHFCDELARLYGSEDYATCMAASYAVENWAAAGFWKELIGGLQQFRVKSKMDFPISFFTWHDRIEDQHAAHTQEELEEYYFENEIDEDQFLKYGNEMMDGIYVFWKGLTVIARVT
ncbi:MAG: hypothetical protein HYS98_01765 [Deltaproteobacteria bacterium]|nr:hypothetical protein [Deltaproteobacteria bacterium]